MSDKRTVERVIQATTMQEGAGVTIHRTIGTSAIKNYDPFLLLDQFGSDNPNDYIAGFPSHPHRGFITLTYMLDGRMEHKDSMGNKGILQSGGVQWMKAASGIIHSEMPKQENGLMRGFQLWINLPADKKMTAPEYQDYADNDIPVVEEEGVLVKVISGHYKNIKGPINDPNTQLLYLDVQLQQGAQTTIDISQSQSAFLYLFEGNLSVEDKSLSGLTFATLSSGFNVTLKTETDTARVILVAAEKINEPIVQYGPFVMNTREEVMQAAADYQSGVLVQ